MSREGKGKGAEIARTGVPGGPDLARGQVSDDRDPREASEKRESFVRLRERYVDAQKLLSSDALQSRPYARGHSNLEWILGSRRDITQDPLDLETKTIELAALWLQDLAVEVGRRPLLPAAGDSDSRALLTREAGETAAEGLRDATARFLIAFRSASENQTKGPAPFRLDGGPSSP